MKKLLATALLIGALSVPAASEAAEYGVYVAPEVGIGFSNISGSDTVFDAGIAIGYDFYAKHNIPVRAEFEYAYLGEDKGDVSFYDGAEWIAADFKVSSHLFMVNAYYDFMKDSAINPYIGAGVGFASVHTKAHATGAGASASASDSSTEFAWQIGAGVAYNFTSNLAADLQYNYTSVGDFNDSFSTDDLSYSRLTLGIRYTF